MEEKRNIPRNPRRRTPLQINRRLQGQLLSWLLVLLSFGFLITGLLIKDKEFSETENRGLTQFPKLTFSAVAGSRAAVCSSSNSMRGLAMVAISSVSA